MKCNKNGLSILLLLFFISCSHFLTLPLSHLQKAKLTKKKRKAMDFSATTTDVKVSENSNAGFPNRLLKPWSSFNADSFNATSSSSECKKPSDPIGQKYEDYFRGYNRPSIHRDMLLDESRTLGYRDAMEPEFFKGKTVLDVGSGTGILSFFALLAGASKVVGVEYNVDLVNIANKTAIQNGFGPDRVLFVCSKMEDLHKLPFPGMDKVDIIVSEWMGYALMYECMLESVLWARDKYLKPDGLMFPDKATLHITGIRDNESWKNDIQLWDDVYGIKMKEMKVRAVQEALADSCDPKLVKLDRKLIKELDLMKVTKEDIKTIESDTITWSDVRVTSMKSKNVSIHAFVLDFDVTFPSGVVLSTSIDSDETHWQQTKLFLEAPLLLACSNTAKTKKPELLPSLESTSTDLPLSAAAAISTATASGTERVIKKAKNNDESATTLFDGDGDGDGDEDEDGELKKRLKDNLLCKLTMKQDPSDFRDYVIQFVLGQDNKVIRQQQFILH